VPIAPAPVLLDTFSEFGMTIEEYRKVGQVSFKDCSVSNNYAIVHPPCVPYEVMVVWQKRRPQRAKIKKGYEKEKKRLFEQRMAGSKPLPDMPAGIAANTKTISDVQPGKFVQASSGSKRKRKNLLSLLE